MKRPRTDRGLKKLKNVVEVYLILACGDTSQLGPLFLKSIDCITDAIDKKDISTDLDSMVLVLAKSMCEATIERLGGLDFSVDQSKQAMARLQDELDPKSHLILLKAILLDLSVVTKVDYTAAREKLTEII
jgi:hypothetical protein